MSVKRVFAIIGIVVGCIAAFVGGVIGVMALMGKFKTPVVKPEKLYFENPELVVVAQYKDDAGKDVIYSFNLKAENNSIDHEVNVKECFIWFKDGIGEDLIELCDKDGNLLKADSKKRYAVNCNETIYFKIKVFNEIYVYNASTWGDDWKTLFLLQDGKYVLNESEEYDETLTYYTMQTYEEKYSSLDLESLINGKVALRARTADDTVQTSQDQVIWIDRNVTSIFLNYGDIPAETNNPNKEQRINIGVNKEVEFNYVVNPEISMQPISKESKKIVELYYNDSKSEDFVLVNLENIKNKTKYSLHKIFDETKCYVDELNGELKLTFLSNEATNGVAHYFKLAIFASYNARAEFLADENNLSITNVERLQHMVSTDLYVQVVNTNVNEVTLSDGWLNLNLFTGDNVVYLSNKEDEAMNLNVEMFATYKEDGDKEVKEKLDVRLNELDFKTISSSMLNVNPKFVLKVNQEVDVKEINFTDYNEITYNNETKQLSLTNGTQTLNCLVNSTIQIGDYLIINSLTYETREYVCNNGVALVYTGTDLTARTIKMLEVDSYLDFYVYDNINGTYTLATEDDIKYSVIPDGQHSSKNWQIVVEDISPDILEGRKTLVLGLLVSNDEGVFNVDNLFAIKPVTINVQELHYNVTNSTATLNLLAKNSGFISEDAGKDFDYFINVDAGTYNACVYVISEAYKDIANVDYVENLYYTDDKGTTDTSDDEIYYVVGYFEGGNFVNKVRTKDNSNITKDTENKLQMLQLKNVCGETTSDVIERLINGKDIDVEQVEILKERIQKLHKTNITIKQNLLIDDSVEFNVEVVDAVTGDVNPEFFYSKTIGHLITITTPRNFKIIERICNFHKITKVGRELDSNYIYSNYPENARTKGGLVDVVATENKVLLIELNVGELLSNDVAVEIKLINVFTGTRTEETLYSFKIKNSAPEKIVYNYSSGSIDLADNQASAPVVTAVISWESNDYKYNWYVNYGESDQKEIEKIELNNKTENGGDGFQDSEFKVVQGITYGVSNNSISIVKDLATGIEGLVINAIPKEDTYLSVTIAGFIGYLKLEVKQNGFELKQNVIEIAGDTGYLGNLISYKYNDGTEQNIYNVDNIQLSNIVVSYSNSKTGTLKTAETITDDKIVKIEYTYDFVDESLTDLTILTIEKTGTNWKFTRTDDPYAALSMSFKVVTKTQTLDCSVKFTSGIEYEVNARAWGEDVKLYQDTNILLYDVKTDDSVFEFEPLIKIRNTSGKRITLESDKGSLSNKVLELSELGEYTINIKADGEKIEPSLTFKVVPNVIVKQIGDLILHSGSDDVSTALYNNLELHSYNTEDYYVYGQTKDVENDNKVILYSTKLDMIDETTGNPILEDKTTDLKSSVTMQSKEELSEGVPYVTTDGTIKTAWINLIGEMQEVNVVVSSGAYEVGTFTAIVKNNNKVKTTDDLIITDNVLNLKAMLDYSGKFYIDGKAFTLSKIEWTYSDEHNNDDYTHDEGSKIPTLNEDKYTNVALKLTFAGTGDYAGKTLVFNGKTINDTELTINILPFELENSDNINKAYSGNEFNENKFNLLKDVTSPETIYGVYDATDIASYFNYIKVLSVKDKNGNSLTSSNLGLVDLTNGLTITFNKISGDNVKAFITYEVEYVGGLKYTYTKEITLQNYQELKVQYPENEAATDVDKYLTIEEITLSNGVKYENVQYEPVVINNDNVHGRYTINLKDIEDKNINRITAKDRTSATAVFTTSYSIENLTILAYQEAPGLSAYVNYGMGVVNGDIITYGNIVINKTNGTITFNQYGSQFSGLIVFRLTSTSGNFMDYFVRLSCLGYSTAVSGNKNVEKDAVYTPGTSVSILVNTLETNFIKKYFNNVTSFDAAKVKMFLLNATVLASDNKMFVDSVVNETIVGTAPDQIIYSGERYTDVGNCTLNINDYTTITLSLIYEDPSPYLGGYVYPIGTLTLYLRPSGAVYSESTGFKDVYTLANEDEIENGEFKYTIPANTSQIPFPEGFAVATTTDAEGNVVPYILNSNGELVTGISGIDIASPNITIRDQVTNAKKFTVFYTKSDYTIKVTYTLEPVRIVEEKDLPTFTIGELNNTKTAFVDTFVINPANYDTYFGTYQGQIKIGDATFTVGAGYKFNGALSQTIISGVTYEINASGVLTLTFEQGLYDDVKEIAVHYTSLSDSTKQDQTYTFNVKRGLYIETTTGDNQGVNAAQRKTTDVVADAYNSPVGSTISINKSDITGGVKYTFAGYTIYIKDASGSIKFEFAEEDTAYVFGENGDFELYSNTLTFATVTGEIYTKANVNFVHMPTNGNKNVDVLFTISNGTEEFKTDASTVDTRTLYLTLAKTYQQVEATYVTRAGEVGTGADKIYYNTEAENVAQNTTLPTNLQEYMFTVPSEIPNGLAVSHNADGNNGIKLKLKKLDNTYIYTDFKAMGFTDPKNPNFINFTKDAMGAANSAINGDYQDITFGSVSANEKCIVYLDNIAGMPTVSYTFQIMADDKVDGFNFSTAGYPGDKNDDEVVDYMSFIVNDKDASAKFSTGKLKIGTIKDGSSKGVFVLDEAGNLLKFLPKAGTDDERILPFEDLSVTIPEDSQGDHDEDSITYSYNVILEMDQYNNSNWDIYIELTRPESDYHLPDMVDIELNIHGTSGYILENLQVVLFNAEVGPKNPSRQSINGGETIALSSVMENSAGATFVLSYDLSKVGTRSLSSFNINSTNPNTNSLILFNETTQIITTRTVGQNVNIDLVFSVSIDGYYLNNVTYQIQLLRTLQFFFNGEEPKGNWSTNSQTTFYTNFVLTNVKGTDTTIFASSGMPISFNVKMSNNKDTIDGITYFSNLLYELEDCLGGEASSVRIDKDPSNSTNPSDDILTVSNEGIIFKKDYTGKLYLTLTAGLLNGYNYTVSWVIDVFGILDIKPQNSKDDEGLKSGNSSYDSGESVDLLGDSAGGTTGLYLKDMKFIEEFENDINYADLTATYQYAIVKYNANDGYNNQQRFEKALAADKSVLLSNKVVNNRTEPVTLPIVPTTGSEESYLVIYKVVISYLGYTTDEYYVAYSVKNNLNISITDVKHGNGNKFDADSINVSERLVKIDSSAETATYLDLFYYSEIYKDASNNEYKIILTDSYKYQVKVNSGNFVEVTTLEHVSGSTNKLKLTYSGGTDIEITKVSAENYWKDSTGTGTGEVINNASVFTLSFSNITEFATFINNIGSINIDSESLGEKQFTITHIAAGRWGIDLSNWNNKPVGSTDVLFNNKLEDAQLIIVAKDNAQPIYTIDKYNKQNNTGFRLHTSNELVAAGSQKFNKLFSKTTMSDTDWITYQNYDIIGVYGNTIASPSTNWVNVVNVDGTKTSASGVSIVEDEVLTIDVPTGNGSTTISYTLQRVKYTATGNVAGVCALEQEFCVVKCTGYDAIYKMNLNANSVELYKQGQDTIVNLSNYFVKFKNNDDDTSLDYGKFVIDDTASVSNMQKVTTPAQPGIDGELTNSNKTYTISEANLLAYRNQNPTTGNIVTITYKVTFGEVVDMQITINYQLPSLPGVIAYQNSLTSEVDVTSIYVPVFNEDGDKSYLILSGQLANVTEITEKSSNFTVENGIIKDATTEDYTGEIKLDKAKVDAYFASNKLVNALEIKYTITTRTNGKTSDPMEFVIVVRRGSST